MDDRYRFVGSRGILVGVILPSRRLPFVGGSPLEELVSLVGTLGVRVEGQVVQYLPRYHSKYCLGKGKAYEVRDMVRSSGVDLVVFDNELTPSQVRNLEGLWGCRVLDRTEVILGIFALHAQSRQAKLQVKLAQLEYILPRLRRMWSHLSRMDGKIGAKGPGEKQIEVDRRLVRRRIMDLRKELSVIQARKEREVLARRDCFQVALVGYTNAGKSSLMNALTGAGVLVADKPFATLDTRTRVWRLSGHRLLLSDTVGFISQIPPHLIASFHATLEEVKRADLLLHVVDISARSPLEQIRSVQGVLEDLGCGRKESILLLNKTDLLKDPVELNFILNRFPRAIGISVKRGEGLERLRERVLEVVSRGEVEIEFCTHVRNGRLFSFIESHGRVLQRRYSGDSAWIKMRISARWAEVLKGLIE